MRSDNQTVELTQAMKEVRPFVSAYTQDDKIITAYRCHEYISPMKYILMHLKQYTKDMLMRRKNFSEIVFPNVYLTLAEENGQKYLSYYTTFKEHSLPNSKKDATSMFEEKDAYQKIPLKDIERIDRGKGFFEKEAFRIFLKDGESLAFKRNVKWENKDKDIYENSLTLNPPKPLSKEEAQKQLSQAGDKFQSSLMGKFATSGLMKGFSGAVSKASGLDQVSDERWQHYENCRVSLAESHASFFKTLTDTGNITSTGF